MSEIRFIVPDALKTVAQATGMQLPAMEVDTCVFSVGDVITWPDAPSLAFLVASRWFRAPKGGDDGVWTLRLEACQHPLDAPELGPPRASGS